MNNKDTAKRDLGSGKHDHSAAKPGGTLAVSSAGTNNQSSSVPGIAVAPKPEASSALAKRFVFHFPESHDVHRYAQGVLLASDEHAADGADVAVIAAPTERDVLH